MAVAQQQDVHGVTRVPEEAAKPPLLARLNARGFRLVMAADAVFLYVAMVGVTAGYIAFFDGRTNGPLRNYGIAYVLFTLIFVATYYFGGGYERELRLGQRAILPFVSSLTLGAWLIVALMQLATQRNFLPRPALLAFLVVA